MKHTNIINKVLMLISPIFVLTTLWVFLHFVDLSPKITPDFFFSSDSEIFKKDQQIQQEFPFAQQVILNIAAPNIQAQNYVSKIETLSTQIEELPDVDSVNSITHGPKNIEEALNNPLWKRLLIGEKQKSSSIVVFVKTENYTRLIKNIEHYTKDLQSDNFNISISGLPYIVEQIRQNLTQDMKVFTLSAVVLCAMVLFLIYRSFLVVIGAAIACATASMLALIIQQMMGIPIGLLTANLATIVFVLTQSHIIFIVSNWRHASNNKNKKEATLSSALSRTLPGSFWAMVTTLLGFGSLIFVEAKPLNQLGIGGSIGTFCAIICAYFVFPAFLRFSKLNPSKLSFKIAKQFPVSKILASKITKTMLVVAVLFGAVGILQLKTDPSLLTYFEKNSELYQGLYYVDENGGSNPLLVVVKRRNGQRLDTQESYDMMWDLQKAFAKHPDVGSAISLPVILAEGDEHWLGKLLPFKTLVNILSGDLFNHIGRSFINEDRTEALFFLRMRENGREKDRLSVVEEIKTIPEKNGFELKQIGGTYYLQGELSASVAKSMLTGMLTLITLFMFISFYLSRSWPATAAITAAIIVVSAIVIGTLGMFGVPIDIISSPAINICLGMAVDEMIHLTIAAKRYAKDRGLRMNKWKSWKAGLNEQSWPALTSAVTIMIGFSVFAFSDFPPSQRFGLEIVFGAGLAMIATLIIVPYIATINWNELKIDIKKKLAQQKAPSK
ncbi:MAG: hypothetical protein CMH30_04745 [Micavibrio sp.]|nr:hypothetical protein [Micavibrio sp.]